MNNQLIKATRTAYSPGSAGYPSSPGQPWIPAHYATVSSTRMVAQYQDQYVYHPAGPYTGKGGVPAYSSVGWYELTGRVLTGYLPVTTYTYTYVEEQPYIPPSGAVPSAPSQVVVDQNLGWNGSAGSVVALQRSGHFSFRVGSTAGIFVGFSPDYLTTGYMRIAFGIHFAHGIAQAYSYGLPIGSPMAYTLDHTFAVRRFAGNFSAWIGTTLLHETPAIDGTMYLVVSIYTGGDYIYDPQFVTEDFYGAAAELPALTSAANWSKKNSAVSLQPLTTEARITTHSAASLLPLTTMSSNFAYADSRGAMIPLVSASEGGMLVPGYALVDALILPLMVASNGRPGGIGQAEVSLYALGTISANYAYGEAKVTLQPLGIISSAYEGAHEATMSSAVVTTETWNTPSTTYLVWDELVGAALVFVADRMVDATYAEHASIETPSSIIHILGTLMQSRVQAGFAVPTFDSNSEIWVINDVGQSNRYENYGFNSYAKLGGRYLGAKSNGVCLLEGDSDDGVAIHASINFGTQDFGTNLLKRVSNCYMGVSSTGTMYLKVLVEGEEYIYAARDSSEQLQQQRVDIGKGIRANYLTFELLNSDGCDFELASVSFAVAALDRRI